jgi:hypothetical protein
LIVAADIGPWSNILLLLSRSNIPFTDSESASVWGSAINIVSQEKYSATPTFEGDRVVNDRWYKEVLDVTPGTSGS